MNSRNLPLSGRGSLSEIPSFQSMYHLSYSLYVFSFLVQAACKNQISLFKTRVVILMIPDPIRQGSTYKISYISKMPFRSFLKEDLLVMYCTSRSLIIATLLPPLLSKSPDSRRHSWVLAVSSGISVTRMPTSITKCRKHLASAASNTTNAAVVGVEGRRRRRR